MGSCQVAGSLRAACRCIISWSGHVYNACCCALLGHDWAGVHARPATAAPKPGARLSAAQQHRREVGRFPPNQPMHRPNTCYPDPSAPLSAGMWGLIAAQRSVFSALQGLWLRSAPRRLQARLGDLALAVDASDEAMFGGATLAAIWERNAIYATDPLCVSGLKP